MNIAKRFVIATSTYKDRSLFDKSRKVNENRIHNHKPAGGYQQAGTKIHGLSQYATQAQSGLSTDLNHVLSHLLIMIMSLERSATKARAK